LLSKSNEAAAVPLLLKDLIQSDDPTALLTSAKAYEQTSDQTRALALYRRLYFFVPASAEASDAASALPRLGSSTSPASVEEAIGRADRLYASKRYADSVTAYGEAFAKFPTTATAENQLRRGIAAYSARKTPEAVSALTSIPTSAGEVRAEALSYLALTYARAAQWEQARATAEEMRKNFSASAFTPRTFVALGRIADDAKNPTDASYFFRSAVNSYPGAEAVAQAQFDLAWDAHERRVTRSHRECSQSISLCMPTRIQTIEGAPVTGRRAILNVQANSQKHALFMKLCWRVTTPTGTATWQSRDWMSCHEQHSPKRFLLTR
jgi:tetratricopeptide (TPR) repeat protein